MSNDVKELVGQLNTAFADFKADHAEELDRLRSGMDEMATKMAYQQMNGGGSVAGPSVGASASKRFKEDPTFAAASEAASRGMQPGQFSSRIHVDSSIRAALTNPDKGGVGDSEFPSRSERGGIHGPVRRPLRLLDALPSRPVKADTVEFIQLSSTGDADYQLTEGAEKSEIQFGGAVKKAYIATVAGHTTASRQVLDDEQALRAQIDRVINHKALAKLEREIVNGAGGDGQIAGLLTQALEFIPTLGTTPADIIGESLVTQANLGYQPSLVVMNPMDWFKIQLTRKNATDDEYVFGSPTMPLPPSLWNQRIVTTPSLAAGQALTIDTSFTTVLDRQMMSILTSNSHKDYFTRNLVLILGELRAGLEVLDTGAVRKFSIAPVAP